MNNKTQPADVGAQPAPALQPEALRIAIHLRQRAQLSRPGNLDTLYASGANELERQHADLATAQAEAKHWRSNHDNVVARLRIFTQRPDIPKELADRLPWYRELVRLQEVEAQAAAQALPSAALGPLAERGILDAIRSAYDLGYNDARNARAVPGDSAPGYKGRQVEGDHGGALVHQLNKLQAAPPAPAAVAVPAAIDSDRCAQDVFDRGLSIGLFDIPKDTANAICAGIAATTGVRVDWHYFGGRVHMKALAAAPAQAYSIDADPQGIRAYVADAITGALACGAQGTGTPPPDHWLTPFWRQARFGQIQYNALRDATDALLNAPGAAQEHATQLAGQEGEQDEGLAQAIDERDTAEGWADGLAGLIGAYFGQDIGEHSSAHNPWQEAKDIIEEAEPYRSATAAPAQAQEDAAALEAPAAPAGLDDSELEDLAHSANQECLSSGMSLDPFLRLAKTVRDRALAAAPQAPAAPAVDARAERDAAFEAVRNRLCGLQRYSFVLDDDGVVRRAQDRTGHWIEFDDAHELFDPVAVDAAIAAQAKGERNA